MSQPARFCIRCGAAVPVADSRFCFSCGAEIVSPDLVAEQSPLPAQEPHEEPPAAPIPRPDQERSTSFTNDRPSPEWWTPGLRRKLRITAELVVVFLGSNTLGALLFLPSPVHAFASLVVTGGYFWWRCWRQNPRQTPDRPPLRLHVRPRIEKPRLSKSQRRSLRFHQTLTANIQARHCRSGLH